MKLTEKHCCSDVSVLIIYAADLAGTKMKFAHKKSKRGKARDQVSSYINPPATSETAGSLR